MLEGIISNLRHQARWLLVVNVVLLALTAQLYRGEKFFGLHRPLRAPADPCLGVSCDVNPDPRCSVASNGTCSNGQCFWEPTNEDQSCGAGLICKFGSCIQETDACVPLLCNTPADSQCQRPIGSCSNGVCSYENLPDGTLCGPLFELESESTDNSSSSTMGPSKWLGDSCLAGRCVHKTSSEVTSFAYDASISTGIVSAALAIEVMITGSGSPDLAAFAITTGFVAMGWTGYSRDTGAYPADTALVRSQNAFVFIGAGFAILFALGLMKGAKEKKGSGSVLLNILAVANIIVGTVQFGLVARLLDQHFQYNEDGVEDSDANILFNWAYPATIYAASVAIAVALSIFATGSVSSGFGAFQLVTGIIALSWASNLQDEGTVGTNPPSDFSDTSLAWQSFAVIAGVFSFIGGLILILKGKSADSPLLTKLIDQLKLPGRIMSIVLIVVFATIIGQVAALFDDHFLGSETRGANMLLVEAQEDNYGNAVSPFAWPISIWTSAVVVGFAVEVLKNGVAQAGITALAMTQAANLLGWAAQHTYYGSQHFDGAELSSSIEGTTRGWEAVSLGSSLVAFFFAFHLLRAQQNDDDLKEAADRVVEMADRPREDA